MHFMTPTSCRLEKNLETTSMMCSPILENRRNRRRADHIMGALASGHGMGPRAKFWARLRGRISNLGAPERHPIGPPWHGTKWPIGQSTTGSKEKLHALQTLIKINTSTKIILFSVAGGPLDWGGPGASAPSAPLLIRPWMYASHF